MEDGCRLIVDLKLTLGLSFNHRGLSKATMGCKKATVGYGKTAGDYITTTLELAFTPLLCVRTT